MSMTRNLLEFILNLLRDSDAKAAFVADPEKALADAGLSEVCHEDVSDALSYMVEYHPVTFVGDRGGHGEGGGVAEHASGGFWPGHDGGPGPHAGTARQVEYITNNYSYADSHDTVVDRSVNQTLWNEGVLAQHFDDHSVTAADHSLATGGDITGQVAQGDGNVIGEGNSVGNTVRRDDHGDDHSVHGSFTGNTIADHDSVAARDNDGPLTSAHHSHVTTEGSALQDAPRHWQNSTIGDSDSPTEELPHHSVHHGAFPSGAWDHGSHPEFFSSDSAITHTDQHGLINATLSPAVAVPVHHNEFNVLSHPAEEHLPA